MDLALLALGLAFRPRVARTQRNPIWGLHHTLDWGVRTSMLGYDVALGFIQKWGYAAGTVAGYLMIAAVLAIALARVTRPAWLLAGMLALHAVGYVTITIMLQGRPEDRYLIGPELMLFAALAALLVPVAGADWRRRAPIIGLAVLIALVCAANYRLNTARTPSTPWDEMVARGRAVCADTAQPAVFLFPNGDGRATPAPAVKPAPKKLPSGFGIWLPCNTLR